jgi:hypothetical protein
MCTDTVSVLISPEKLFLYNNGGYAQEVLSAYGSDIRERFITGYCDVCWDSIFSAD